MPLFEWVEVQGKDVEIAIAAALEELGLDSSETADVEVLQEPERGFLGMGGKDAIVRVKLKKPTGKKRRRRGRERGDSRGVGPKEDGKKKTPPHSSGTKKSQKTQKEQPRQQKTEARKQKEKKVEAEVDREAQAEMVKDFLTGLLDAFGLEGEVECTVEDDIVLANVTGEQTEALVGPKGVILQATLELSRTIVQRRSQAGARIRLDIGGYTERRREALRIYTGRLVEKVTEEGGEVMLEPMNAADRKVVHDAAADLRGVKTFSEGEEPRRSVVIARLDG